MLSVGVVCDLVDPKSYLLHKVGFPIYFHESCLIGHTGTENASRAALKYILHFNLKIWRSRSRSSSISLPYFYSIIYISCFKMFTETVG